MYRCSCCMEDFLTHAPCLKCCCCRTGPFTEYGFKIRATNAAGHSPWSSIGCLRTASGPPTAPTGLHADGMLIPLICPRMLVVISTLAHQRAAPPTQFWQQGLVKHCFSEALFPVAHAGSSSTSILTCWGTPANDYGAPITAYHLEVSPVPPRQKSAPAWQRAYSGIATTCEVSLFYAPCHLPLHCLHCP